MKTIPTILGVLAIACGPLRSAEDTAAVTRLKDLVTLEGVRDNQLLGYGLVVGLAGTGDRQQTMFSTRSLANLLQRMGVVVDPTAIQVKNTAAVMVTATLPPFAQPGMRIDVTASSMGDSQNLQGGLLVMTALQGVDGSVYAMAQGPVVTGGFVAGRAGTTQTVNHPTVGRVPNGAIIERLAPSRLAQSSLKLQLREADFITASRVAKAVNNRFAAGTAPIAHAENAGLVTVAVPAAFSASATDFVAELEALTVTVDRLARVIVNERTGTIVLGKDVRIGPVAILQGNLTVEIKTTLEVSQPAPFAAGTTQVVPETTVGVKQEKARNVVLKLGATVEELVRALAAIGASARDVIAILQGLHAAGALEADLEVI